MIAPEEPHCKAAERRLEPRRYNQTNTFRTKSMTKCPTNLFCVNIYMIEFAAMERVRDVDSQIRSLDIVTRLSSESEMKNEREMPVNEDAPFWRRGSTSIFSGDHSGCRRYEVLVLDLSHKRCMPAQGRLRDTDGSRSCICQLARARGEEPTLGLH